MVRRQQPTIRAGTRTSCPTTRDGAADRIGRTPRHRAAIDTESDPLADLPSPSSFPRRPDLTDSDALTPVELEAVRGAVVAVVDLLLQLDLDRGSAHIRDLHVA